MDIKYLPQMPDETRRRYLFVAIDRATRWVFMEIYPNRSDSSSTDFLIKVKNACPMLSLNRLCAITSRFTMTISRSAHWDIKHRYKRSSHGTKKSPNYLLNTSTTKRVLTSRK
jgi:hypothetical protein